MGFQVLEDPRQPRERVETADGGTFIVAIDAKIALPLATSLVRVARAIDPTLKGNFIEHI
jgi:hypothetical protein